MKFWIVFLLTSAAWAQGTLAGVNGDCTIGGEQALTQGLPSTGTQQIGTSNVNSGAGVQASFPRCLVTVLQTGTSTPATIYSDNLVPPTLISSTFTANVDGSFTFFAAQGSCYDIVLSSGIVPLPYSRTFSDVCLGTGSGGGGGGSGTVASCGTAGSIAWYQTTGTTATCDTNLTDLAGKLTYAGAAGISALILDTTGMNAGLVALSQGPDNSGLCGTNSVCDMAPTSVTGYVVTRAGLGPSSQSIAIYAGLVATNTAQSWFPITVSGTNITFPGNVSTSSDGVHAGSVQVTGNTTVPSLGSNTVSWIGPNSASFTAYGLQFPSTAPSGTQYLGCGTPASGVSTCAWGAGGGGSGVTGSGTTGKVPEWTSPTALGDSPIIDGGSTGISAAVPTTGTVDWKTGTTTGGEALLAGTGSGTNTYFGSIPQAQLGTATGSFGYCIFGGTASGITCKGITTTQVTSVLSLTGANSAGQTPWTLGDQTSLIGLCGVVVGTGSGSACFGGGAALRGIEFRAPTGNSFSFRVAASSTAVNISSAGVQVQTGQQFQSVVGAFSTLLTCNGGEEGSFASVNDSTTNTWGATVTGGSNLHVLAYCDGTNWTVAGK